jgi:hypothetical protein
MGQGSLAGCAEQKRLFLAVNLDDDDPAARVQHKGFKDFHPAFALEADIAARDSRNQAREPSLPRTERQKAQQAEHDRKGGDVSGGINDVQTGNSFLFNAALSGAAQLHSQQTGV